MRPANAVGTQRLVASSLSFPTRGGVGSGARRHPLGAAVALGLVLLLAVGLRLALVANAPAFIVNVDSADFFAAAYHLAEDGTFPLPAKRAPLYPLFLAGLTALVGPSLELIALAQHLLGLATILLAYLLGALAFNRVVGLISAAWLAVNGSLLAMEHTIISEALLTPLLLASLLLLFRGLRGGRLRTAALAGVALGLCALTRPTVQPVLALAALALLLSRRPWRFRLAAVGVLAIGFAVVVSPWILRNRVVHGVTSISSGLGDALYARTRRHDTGFTWRDRSPRQPGEPANPVRVRIFELAKRERYSATVRSDLERKFGLSPVQADAALRDAALQVIRQEPQHYLHGTLAMLVKLGLGYERAFTDRWAPRFKPKFQRTWPETIRFALAPPEPWPEEQRATTEWLLALYRDQHLDRLIVMLFCIGAVVCCFGARRGLPLLPLIVLSQLLLAVALDGALPRYRYPLQPLITLVAVGGLAACWQGLALTARRLARRAGQLASHREPGGQPRQAARAGLVALIVACLAAGAASITPFGRRDSERQRDG